MSLQNSGTITLDQVGQEFQGSKPYKLQEHYRGGGRVPTSISGNSVPGNPGNYVPGNPGGCVPNGNFGPPETCPEGGVGPGHSCNLPNAPIVGAARSFRCPSGDINLNQGSGTCGSNGFSGYACAYEYSRVDAYPGRINGARWRPHTIVGPNNPTSNPPNPPTTNPSTPINTDVPSSGTIKLSNFYGARRS